MGIAASAATVSIGIAQKRATADLCKRGSACPGISWRDCLCEPHRGIPANSNLLWFASRTTFG